MSVLRRLSTAPDAIPDRFAGALSHLTSNGTVPEELDPGHPNATESRLLASDLGTDQGALYAFPTDKGQVCFIFTSGPYAGCVQQFGGEVGIPYVVVGPDKYYTGSGTEVFGLVPDSVVAIDATVDGKRQPAQVKNNSFFIQLDAPSAYLSNLVIEYAGGTTDVVPIAPPPADQ
jgi:hypothetical protein